MHIATWNLNHRAGKGKVSPETADAAMSLAADVLVFTEFFPRDHEALFRATLANGGWTEQRISVQPTEVANRVFLASRLPLSRMTLELPTFDQQFPANLLGVTLPSLGVSVLGARIPAYPDRTSRLSAWDWLESTADSLKHGPSVLIGDLNAQTSSAASRGGTHFRRILANGWHRAAPGGATFFGHKGRTSEIDHVLATSHCVISDAKCVHQNAISDHAALVCRVELSDSLLS